MHPDRLLPFRLLLLLSAAVWAVSCSTTKNLPEGEVLYTGIRHIRYTDHERAKKKTAADSAGVITSIAQSVREVSELLHAGGAKDTAATGTEASAADDGPTISKEQAAILQKKARMEREAFETTKEEVDAVLAYPPNSSLFGSSSIRSPFPFGLWVHNSFVKKKSKLSKWILSTFGTTPVLMSSVNPEVRAKVATNTLRNYGYFRGKVDYEIHPTKNPRKEKISYYIRTRELFTLDSIAYLKFPPIADSLLRATQKECLLLRGNPFRVTDLSAERTRIETLLRNNGYYYHSASYITFRADTLIRPQHVQLQVTPVANIPAYVHHPWYIGKTTIRIRRSISDTLGTSRQMRNYNYRYSGSKIPLRPRLWLQSIMHRRGELYRQNDEKQTLEHLSGLGVFSQMDVNYVPRDTTAGCDSLDVVVSAVLDKPYDFDFEMNVTSKSNDQLGPGMAFGLARRNAFRGAERIAFRIYGSYEWQTGRHSGGSSDLFNSYEIGTSLSFHFPRFVFPGISRRLFRFPSSTTFSLDADWMNRAGFFNMVKMGLGATYKWHKKANRLHELVLFNLDYDQLLSRTHGFDSIMAANPALYVSMRDQFVPSVQYTYTYSSRPGRRHPHWWQTSVKEAGNLTSALYAAFGRPFNESGKELFNNPFAQFIKITSEYHKTFRLSGGMQLATRAMGGIIYSYGNSRIAPYSEQFSSGGANSIRAFTVRTIGPGRFRSDKSKYAYMDQTGDVKLEANVELRFPLFGNLHGAAFVDAGNVWLLRADENRPGGQFSLSDFVRSLALGTGVGIRYDMEFLVLRLDLGIALHEPYDTDKSGYYNIEKFSDGLGLHFAIGYPF